jgi:uncharacterized protein YecE (DUF72 family)
LWKWASWDSGWLHLLNQVPARDRLVVDEPQGFANTVPPIWEATHGSHALVRMHGRNERTWNNRTPSSSGRFNYEYDDAELEGMASQIMRLDQPDLRVHVVMNNNAEDFAQANGRRLFDTLLGLGANGRLPTARDLLSRLAA